MAMPSARRLRKSGGFRRSAFRYQSLLALGILGWSLSTGTVGKAQDQPADNQNGQNAATEPGYAPAVRYPDNGFTFLHHSSTAGEGYLRGAAAYTRALGAANLDNSLAAMNYQEAYRRSLENALLYAQTYYAKRDLWFDYREKTRRKPLTPEGYRRLAEAAGAGRLTLDQFDPETGELRWPALLQANVLQPYRDEVNEAMATRSVHDTGMASRTYERVRIATEAMEGILDTHKTSIPSHLYVNAVKFIESVRLESRFAPPGKDAEGAEEAPAETPPQESPEGSEPSPTPEDASADAVDFFS